LVALSLEAVRVCLEELIFAAVHFLPLVQGQAIHSSSSELFLDLPSFSTVIRRFLLFGFSGA
jgi:hypothetical protein